MSTTAPHAPELIPRRAVLCTLGAGLVLVAGVAALRAGGHGPAAAGGAVRAQRSLRFVDRADGGIDVVDGSNGQLVDRAHGEQGFLRGTLRGLARERRRRGLGGDTPLLLQVGRDGRLALLDPATGERIDLQAFGPDNAAVFARWIGPATPTQERP